MKHEPAVRMMMRVMRERNNREHDSQNTLCGNDKSPSSR
jgi:hypothetical protein